MYNIFQEMMRGSILSSLCLHTATATSFELCAHDIYSAAELSQLNVNIRNSCRPPLHTSKVCSPSSTLALSSKMPMTVNRN